MILSAAAPEAAGFFNNPELIDLGVVWGLRVLYAAVILIGGLWIAGFVSGQIKKQALKSDRFDKTLANFFASLVRYALMAVVIIAVLQKFGVPVTSLVAVLGAATLAIGLALQGTLGNVAAGVMIVMIRPYRLGDFVEIADASGTVSDINLFYTALETIGNEHVYVPNGQAWNDVIVNYSSNARRRTTLNFGISYDDDIDRAIEIMKETASAHENVLADPEPWVAVSGLGDSSVNLDLRVWVEQPNFFQTNRDLIKLVKQAFDREGISIPYPHQVEIQKIVEVPQDAIPLTVNDDREEGGKA